MRKSNKQQSSKKKKKREVRKISAAQIHNELYKIKLAQNHERNHKKDTIKLENSNTYKAN